MQLIELLPLSRARRDEFRRNYALLRRELARIAPDYEQKPYQDLLRPEEELSVTRRVNDDELYFSAQTLETLKDGTLYFCIDAMGLPTILGRKPSWYFYKRRDGSVYHRMDDSGARR
jgi:hypothetical protein